VPCYESINEKLLPLALVSVIVTTVVAQGTLTPPSPSGSKDGLATGAIANAKKIPRAKRAAMANRRNLPRATPLRVKPGSGKNLLNNEAATEQEAVLGYFVAQRSQFASLAYGLLKNSAVADQIEPLAKLYEGTKLAQLIRATVKVLRAGGEDEKKTQADLDQILATLQYAYEKKGEAATYHFAVGGSSAILVCVGLLLDSQDIPPKSQEIFTSLQSKLAGIVANAPKETNSALKSAAENVSVAKLKSKDDVFKAFNNLNAAYKKATD